VKLWLWLKYQWICVTAWLRTRRAFRRCQLTPAARRQLRGPAKRRTP